MRLCGENSPVTSNRKMRSSLGKTRTRKYCWGRRLLLRTIQNSFRIQEETRSLLRGKFWLRRKASLLINSWMLNINITSFWRKVNVLQGGLLKVYMRSTCGEDEEDVTIIGGETRTCQIRKNITNKSTCSADWFLDWQEQPPLPKAGHRAIPLIQEFSSHSWFQPPIHKPKSTDFNLFFCNVWKGWHCRCFWWSCESRPQIVDIGLSMYEFIITATRDLPPKTDPPLKWKTTAWRFDKYKSAWTMTRSTLTDNLELYDWKMISIEPWSLSKLDAWSPIAWWST
jgi:hypothetical protein